MADTFVFTDNVRETEIDGLRLFTVPTPVDRVVTWTGAFQTAPDFAAGDKLVQEFVVQLLDKGTRTRDRFAIAEVLESRGAKLSFNNQGLWVGFSGASLRDDVPEVLAVMAEQLRDPLFDPDELEKVRARVAARIQRSMENTGAQADRALARRLYPRQHPNYAFTAEESLERTQAITLEEVRAYHEAHFGARALTVAFAGDLDAGLVERTMQDRLGDWPAPDAEQRYAHAAEPEAPGVVDVPVPDKANLDVRVGHTLRLRRDDADYVPLLLANYIFGGNFSARLMDIIRGQMGLTYGIGSTLDGVTVQYDGHFEIRVTLSPENLERGIEAILDEVRRYVDEGATAEELADKQTTLTGLFTVGLGTTRGLGRVVLRNAKRGFDLAYLDAYPRELTGTTLDDVNAAIRTHLDPGALHIARAGTLPAATPIDS